MMISAGYSDGQGRWGELGQLSKPSFACTASSRQAAMRKLPVVVSPALAELVKATETSKTCMRCMR